MKSLREIDFMRRNFYADLELRLTMEFKIESGNIIASDLFSDKYHAQYLPALTQKINKWLLTVKIRRRNKISMWFIRFLNLLFLWFQKLLLIKWNLFRWRSVENYKVLFICFFTFSVFFIYNLGSITLRNYKRSNWA